MKKLIAITAAAAIVAMAGSAMAADTNTLTVQASVTGTCKFVSASSTLDFGALDPSLATNPTKQTTTTFWCTKGVTTDLIAAGNGLHYDATASKRQMLDTGTSGDLIPYTLTLTKAGSNAGPGSPRTLTIQGDILNSDYKNKTASNYSDTVQLSINP
jgi:hypothetical protein